MGSRSRKKRRMQRRKQQRLEQLQSYGTQGSAALKGPDANSDEPDSQRVPRVVEGVFTRTPVPQNPSAAAPRPKAAQLVRHPSAPPQLATPPATDWILLAKESETRNLLKLVDAARMQLLDTPAREAAIDFEEALMDSLIRHRQILQRHNGLAEQELRSRPSNITRRTPRPHRSRHG